MSNLSDWDKLKPYESSQRKSFEELCYQCAVEEYKSNGIFTSIDDSGGGDGVEFYLTLPNGDEWGWQAKYFGRLSESGRKEQIKKSLQTAYKKHSKLKKWFLCSKLSFTPSEKEWFEKKLATSKYKNKNVLPKDHGIELIHWGDSEILRFLQKYPSIDKFFFDAKILTWEWFEQKYQKLINMTSIQSKYKSMLHIQTDADESIIKILGGKRLVDLFESEMKNQQVKMYADEHEQSVKNLFSNNDVEDNFKPILNKIRELLKDKDAIIEEGIERLYEFTNLLISEAETDFKTKIKEFNEYIQKVELFQKEYYEFSESPLCEPIEPISKEGKTEEETKSIKEENDRREKVRDLIFGPLYSLGEYAISSIKAVFMSFELLDQNALHISGEAGMGKTHVSFNIFEHQILEKKPALFLLARNFTSEVSIETQIKEQLDIPTAWSFGDFLGALNVAGKVYHTKIPIIVDGLNESTCWQDIYSDNLDGLIINISNYSHLVLITTYRKSYEQPLFPDDYFDMNNFEKWRKNIASVRGFESLTWEAMEKYFEFYNITLTQRSDAITEFKNPLYLKIFCETNKDKTVSFTHENLFDVFEQYLVKCNENICKNLDKATQFNPNYCLKKLTNLAEQLWNNKSRSAPYSESIGDNKIFSEKEATAFLQENLLLDKDWNNGEKIYFTYDLLAGYLIAKHLFEKHEVSIAEFILSNEFNDNIFKKEHPLFNDILRCFCILLIKHKDMYLFEMTNNAIAIEYSLQSIFEINVDILNRSLEKIKKFLKDQFHFSDSYKKRLLDLAAQVELDVDHPLNFHFLSDLLFDLSMSERDIFWSEYIRDNNASYDGSYLSNFVKDFKEVCQEENPLSSRVHIAAKKLMWILTSNIRKLRDEVTEALYWYSRKYPEQFVTLLEYSLNINDPYVPERMLAVCYGLTMAKQNDLTDTNFMATILPKTTKFLGERIFSKNATNATTHLLLRDYAKRTIDIALIHFPDLLTKEEKERIKYPLSDYPHLAWKACNDKNLGEYQEGNVPIHMDFKDYTIRRLIQDRAPYQGTNDFKTVVANIFWRLYDLGYSLEKFGSFDKFIAQSNWNSSRNQRSGQVDRYGKKYAWIAFYEMAGHRCDLGLIKEWNGEISYRISDVDIDPSFPTELQRIDFMAEKGNDDYLGSQTSIASEWYDNRADLQMDKYLHIKKKFGDTGEAKWVLLKSTIDQKATDKKRDVYTVINAVFLKKADSIKVNRIIDTHENYSFDLIRARDHYYLYEGEIPWSDLMPINGTEELLIHYGKKQLKVDMNSAVFENSWESHRNEVNPSGQTVTPSKEICASLNLFLKPQTSNLYENNGKLASIAFKDKNTASCGATFIYLRKDLLDKYLKSTNTKLFFFQWSEKRYFSDGVKFSYGKDDQTEFRQFFKIYNGTFRKSKIDIYHSMVSQTPDSSRRKK